MIPFLVTEAISIGDLFNFIASQAFGGTVFFALVILAVIGFMIYKSNLGWGVGIIVGVVFIFGIAVTAKEEIFTSLFAGVLAVSFALIGFALIFMSRR